MAIRRRQQDGFTLIELMVVIVIIGILVAIALPNFIGAQDRAKISSVKANMHTLQTMAETYSVDWGGVYASGLNSLNSEANQAGREYWKEFINPFTGKSGNNFAYHDVVTLAGANSSNAGLTLYNPIFTGTSPVTRYYIYGLDKAGSAILDKGQRFYLSNS